MSNREKVEDLLDRAEKFRKNLDINRPLVKSRLTKQEQKENIKIFKDIIENPSKYFKRKIEQQKGDKRIEYK